MFQKTAGIQHLYHVQGWDQIEELNAALLGFLIPYPRTRVMGRKRKKECKISISYHISKRYFESYTHTNIFVLIYDISIYFRLLF